MSLAAADGSEEPTRSGRPARVSWSLWAGATLLLSLAVFAIVIAADFRRYRCQEGCAPDHPEWGWEFVYDSWQWTGQLVIAWCTLPFALGTFVLLALRRRRAAAVSAALTLLVGGTWLAMYLPAQLSVF